MNELASTIASNRIATLAHTEMELERCRRNLDGDIKVAGINY
jgi:hypothetical protein